MFKILNKQILSKDVKRVDIHAPAIAAKVQAGQFVVVIPRAGSEWVSLCVTETELQRELISVIFQERDAATVHLGAIPIHEEVYSVIGPLGSPVGGIAVDRQNRFYSLRRRGIGSGTHLAGVPGFQKPDTKSPGSWELRANRGDLRAPDADRLPQNSYHDKGRQLRTAGTVADMVRQVLGSGDVGASMRPGRSI